MSFSCSKRRILRTHAFALNAVGATMLVTAMPAAAQEEVWPSNAEAHPGEIVYSRDVPNGTATRRFSQGQARTVAPDQSKLIIESILVGLEPLSDAEQASVSAPLGRLQDGVQSTIDIGLSALSRAKLIGDFTRSENGASAAGGIVGQGLSVLPTALAVIGKTAGGGQ